jgi:hypothetical protein
MTQDYDKKYATIQEIGNANGIYLNFGNLENDGII